ncbi:MAG: transpeptidase family protein [Bacteroidetes bacterium]|nr:transpeptidase family protein [Bacteroidota bacterium]
MNNSRALLVILFVLLLFAALIVKLVDIQIIKSEELKYYAQRQQTRLETIKAERGLIYDRCNVLLVYNRNDVTFNLDLRMLHENRKDDLAEKLSSVFVNSKSHYLKLMEQKGKTIVIERKVPVEKAALLKNINLSALFSVDEPTRIYQYGSMASHLLGYVNKEFVGVNGVAKYYEDELNGEEGSRLVERDALGRVITFSDEETKTAIPGDNLILTIDKNYQTILEEELKLGLQKYKGRSATGILMDPNTGEILALANISDFNPNFYWKYDDYQRKNRAITDTYEPGSTFKAFTMAALIEEDKCYEDELVNVENGTYKFRNTYIRDTHSNRYLTVRGILEESSNIGISKLVQRLNNDAYFKYLRGFGFGTFTSVTLPGEVKGTLKKPNRWSKYTKTFMSFGYEVSVTPLQLINAFSAIINGGILYEPHILKGRTDINGKVIFESSPVIVRRVISEETSARVRKMLRGVVKNGTGSFADSKLIPVGGKTGTSQKLIDGKYSKSKYNASFIGFFPADNPQMVCLIIVNSPKEKYGGRVAAPIFKNITERILETNLKIFQKSEEYKTHKNVESKIVSITNEKEVAPKVTNVVNVSGNYPNSENQKILMPDLRGQTVKDALIKLNLLGLNYDINGSGIVTSQSISPGLKIKPNQVCKINCSETIISGANIY